jgi:hypothetical protein
MNKAFAVCLLLVPLVLSFPVMEDDFEGPIDLDSGIAEMGEFRFNATFKRAVIAGMYGSEEQQQDFASCSTISDTNIQTFTGFAAGIGNTMHKDNYTFHDNITDFVALGKECVTFFYPLYTKCIQDEDSQLDKWWKKVNNTDFNWTARVESLDNISHTDLTKFAKQSAEYTLKKDFFSDGSGQAAGATFYFFASASSLNISLFMLAILFLVLL